MRVLGPYLGTCNFEGGVRVSTTQNHHDRFRPYSRDLSCCGPGLEEESRSHLEQWQKCLRLSIEMMNKIGLSVVQTCFGGAAMIEVEVI